MNIDFDKSRGCLTDDHFEAIAKMFGFEQQEGFCLVEKGKNIIESVFEINEPRWPPSDIISLYKYLATRNISTVIVTF